MSKNNIFVKGVLLGTLIVVCLCSCGKNTVQYLDEDAFSTQELEESQQSEDVNEQDVKVDDLTSETESVCIYVHVCGQIYAPGVYTLPEGSRIYELFELAGGFTEEADTDYWNQARMLQDGEMIYVPTKEEAKSHQWENEQSDAKEDSKKININTATKEELMTLPGIGETRALAILAYRQENGPFSSVEDLKNVEGIKDGVFSKMKDYIEI